MSASFVTSIDRGSDRNDGVRMPMIDMRVLDQSVERSIEATPNHTSADTRVTTIS